MPEPIELTSCSMEYSHSILSNLGAGKTSLLSATIEGLKDRYNIVVIESDIDLLI